MLACALTIGASPINGLPEGNTCLPRDRYGQLWQIVVSHRDCRRPIKAPVVADDLRVRCMGYTRATLSGSVLEAGVGDDCGFKYRIKGSSEWTTLWQPRVKNASGFQTTVGRP